jgi:hypothetical protein
MAAITRERADLIVCRLDELKEQTVNNVREKARRLNDAISKWDLMVLLNTGYSEFKTVVQQEYAQTPYAEFVEILLPSCRNYFFSERGLNREICQIIPKA